MYLKGGKNFEFFGFITHHFSFSNYFNLFLPTFFHVDQAWRVYCYSCIPTDFLVDHFTTWRAAERFFVEFFSFLFDNTCWCYLVFASLYPLLFAINYCYVVIKIWLRVVGIFEYCLYFIFCTYIVEYKLALENLNLGSKHSLVFFTH